MPKENLQDLVGCGLVLMGDAAHAEPIVGGKGANLAITDAFSLAKRIANGSSSGQEDLKGWIVERYPIWQQSVENAMNSIQILHNTTSERL